MDHMRQFSNTEPPAGQNDCSDMPLRIKNNLSDVPPLKNLTAEKIHQQEATGETTEIMGSEEGEDE